MTWHPTQWHPPQTDSPVRVRFRCGDVSKHTYRPGQLNWRDRGFDFDITHFRIEEN